VGGTHSGHAALARVRVRASSTAGLNHQLLVMTAPPGITHDLSAAQRGKTA
jgi:hypothetical protein